VTIRSKIAKTSVAVATGVMAVTTFAAIPSFAQAQDGGYYYDPCKRERTSRGTVGGVIGALAGAAIGSNVAARGVRTEGAVLGGAVGAVGGAMVGHSSAACEPGGYAPRTGAYQSGPAYYSERQPPPQPYYDRSYDRSRYYDDRDRYADSYTVVDRPAASADDCTLAESPIYLPDGRMQKRFVRVCRDSTGRYQVVE